MAPATTVDTERTAEHEHIDGGTVGHVSVVPLVDTGTDDNHTLAACLLGCGGKGAGRPDDLVGRDARNLLLPLRGVGQVIVVARGAVDVAQAAVDAIMGHEEVEDIGAAYHTIFGLDMDDGHLVLDDVGMTRGGEMGILIVGTTEIGVEERHDVVAMVEEGETWREGLARAHVLAFEVPAPLVVPSAADAAVGCDELAGGIIDGDGVPLGFLLHAEVVLEVGGAQEHAGGIASVTGILELDEEGEVGELAHVVVEIGHGAVVVELLEDDMAHSHAQGGVGALLGRHPHVGELRGVAVVGRDDGDLGTFVAHLGIKGRIGCARRRHVAAPEQEEGGVVPVGALGDVGLFAPGLWRRRRQVAIEVVEAQTSATKQTQVAGAGGIAEHGEGGDWREADETVGTELLDGIDVAGRHDLQRCRPVEAHEAAEAAHLLIAFALVGILDDGGPGLDGVGMGCQSRLPEVEEFLTNHRMLHAAGVVEIPAVAGAAGTAARLMVGQTGPRSGVVGLLHLPRDDALLDEDAPRTGTGAVDTVGGAHLLVVGPAGAIEMLPLLVGNVLAVDEVFELVEYRVHSLKIKSHQCFLRIMPK